MYVELKAKPEDQRSLKEFVQVKVYENLEKYLRELEQVRLENDELVREVQDLRMKVDRDNRELDSMKKLAKEREEDWRRKLDSMERKNKELETDIYKINSQYKTLLDRGAKDKDQHDLNK